MQGMVHGSSCDTPTDCTARSAQHMACARMVTTKISDVWLCMSRGGLLGVVHGPGGRQGACMEALPRVCSLAELTRVRLRVLCCTDQSRV